LANGDCLTHLLFAEPLALAANQLTLHLTDQRNRPTKAQQAESKKVPRYFSYRTARWRGCRRFHETLPQHWCDLSGALSSLASPQDGGIIFSDSASGICRNWFYTHLSNEPLCMLGGRPGMPCIRLVGLPVLHWP
jgi:hypothetical protein